MSIADQERDDVLLRRAGKGDEDAFALLYRRHQGALYRFALRMSGNAWAAEEIVQDVFMTLMRDPKKYDAARGTLGGFLYGVTRNRACRGKFPSRKRPKMARPLELFCKTLPPLPSRQRSANASNWFGRRSWICQRSLGKPWSFVSLRKGVTKKPRK